MLTQGKQAQQVIADKGYDVDGLIAQIEQQGAYERHLYKERYLIECLFGNLKQYRRIFSRFDKLARNYWSFLCFACTLIWLR